MPTAERIEVTVRSFYSNRKSTGKVFTGSTRRLLDDHWAHLVSLLDQAVQGPFELLQEKVPRPLMSANGGLPKIPLSCAKC